MHKNLPHPQSYTVLFYYFRWWAANVWNSFFKDFLNIESGSSLPDLAAQRAKFEDLLFKKHKTNFNQVASTLQLGMRRK